ncbi:nuclear hormone receptor HR96 [Stomoxys calcitrans]|uniref:nuclear hormone receptor HR96 n=1 Tax=Stomoxys calcitrans TaxID=35570 RepID=UPI0027E2C7DC|nr:nuclear hormone receptor HR96 [Stomoxys calcitrans]
MSPPKVCSVCGDKALGYNFNAVTCESCKAFFRRNALTKKQFTCPFNQNCEITVVTRRFCQKCRLKKCLDIGMKSENIMSEEDKMIKRRKIETNRAKRKLSTRMSIDVISCDLEGDEDERDGIRGNAGNRDVCRGDIAAADSSSTTCVTNDSRSSGSYDLNIGSSSVTHSSIVSHSKLQLPIGDYMVDVNPDLMSGEKMVEFIVCDPDRASQAISKLMRTPAEALSTLEKIINSQKDALRLISHLINYPGDALKIISKIMNSPFNALTVFTKFMSSPTDALEIISKIVSSPQDVLQFIKNLMDSPENAMDIMNKFMNTPAEALRMLNRILNGPSDGMDPTENIVGDSLKLSQMENLVTEPTWEKNDTTTKVLASKLQKTNEHTLIHSMLSYPSPNNILPPNPSPSPNTPLSMDSSNYVTPPPSTGESLNMAASPLGYHSSPGISTTSVNSIISSPHDDQLPSTSTVGLLSPTEEDAAAAAEFANEHFDIKTFIQNPFPENAAGDSLNSLESVLTEVIRIEFQAFNNLPPERVKQENANPGFATRCEQAYGPTGGRHMACFPQQIPLQCQQQQVCSPSSVMLSRDLNETELVKLRELKLASEALYLPVDEDLSVLMSDDRIKPGDTHQDPKLLQVINLTAVAIKRLIKMAKKIAAFRDMCQEDQVALLKGGCTEMMIMRSVMTYDDDRNTWRIPHTKEDMSNIRAEVLKLAKGNVYEEHLKFISTFDEKWRMDENIILIMCAIVLFSPSRPRIIHSDVIRLEQNSYYYLLRRYLGSVYPGCEAKSAFIKLIQKISDVERLNQFIIGVYLNVNPSQVEPLLREIFDLKNH